MQKKNTWLVYVVVVVLLFVIILIYKNSDSQTARAERSIKVALVMPQSGDLAVFGQSILRGTTIALEQSGIASGSVQLIAEDAAGPVGSVLSAWNKAIQLDHADIIVGPFGPAQTLTVAPTLPASTTMTVIAVSNCDDRFKQYPTIFCMYPSITDQVLHAINFMKSKGWKNIYFITENSEFGVLVENILKEHSSDITLIGTEKFVSGQTKDLRTQVAKMTNAKPDAIYGMFGPTEGFIMLRQYPKLAQGIPLYIGTDVNEKQMKEMFGQNSPGIYIAARMSQTYNKEFVETYRTRYGAEPDYFAALMHSSLSVMFSALKENGLNDTGLKTLPKEMIGREVSGAGVEGFSFRGDRTVEVPLHTYRYEEGGFLMED